MDADGVYARRRPAEGQSPNDAQLLAMSSPQRAAASPKRRAMTMSASRRASPRASSDEAKSGENGALGKPVRV